MGKLLLFVLVALFGCMAAAVVAYQQFGILGVLGVAVFVVVCLKLLISQAGKIFQQLLMAPFQMKGAVLANAAVQVHGVASAAAPSDHDADDDVARRWYQVECSITPAPREDCAGFSHWEPAELELVSPDAEPTSLGDRDPADECLIQTYEIWRNGTYVDLLEDDDDAHDDDDDDTDDDDLGSKVGGTQRLRLLVGVPGELSRIRFQYYFEQFGAIDLVA